MPASIASTIFQTRVGNWLDTPHHTFTGQLKIGKKVTVAAVAGAGTGGDYTVGATITLANGVVLTVATAGATTVRTVSITNAGHLAIGATTPTNPVSQVSSSGTGTGATFNLTWADDIRNPTTTTDVPVEEYDDSIVRTFKFTSLPSVTNYKIILAGTTDNGLTASHVPERLDA